MEQLRQVDIAEALNISEPSASRLMRALNRSALPLNDLDIVKALVVGELAQLGFTMAVGAELITEVEQEVRYVFEGPKRKCWILFIETEQQSYRVTAITAGHLEGLMDSVGMALVIPLHRIVEDARANLERIRRRKSQRAAA
ncbi:hypothetical protein F9K90_07170 [Brucella anthropi]|uniref:hypothetical protein n=1 Tax=Brucella anthropi TaxID=529 RepID=UPI00124D8212|nr:hypothetical protein [Brucella anthropi]KAB2738458.1 hypothetical protein F9K90_07170 [Brucella anthropi]